MAVNGKQKGNTFERDIANKLSERFRVYTGIEKSFRRNPDSGSFFGGSNISRTEEYDTDYAIYGDLICPRKFNFAIECKLYQTAPPLNAIVTEIVTEWDKWLKQATQDAEVSKKSMMMIVKYNRTETLVFLQHDFSYAMKIMKPAIYYNGYYAYSIKEVLQQDDDFFFSK